MHILLTGATGFLGSHLLRALVNIGHNISVLKRSTSSIHRVSDIIEKCRYYDIDKVSLESIFKNERINIIIHVACTYGRENEPISSVIETNVKFPIRLLELASNNDVSFFINVDTMLPAYVNSYSLSKSQFVEWLDYFAYSHMKIVNMKIEHMYGPGDDSKKFVNWLILQLKMNVPSIGLTKGEQKRDFIYIDDVVSAFLVVLENLSKLQNYSEFQIGTGNSITLRNTVEKLLSLWKESYPETITKIEFGKIPYREQEPMEIVVDSSQLIELGWKKKYGLDEGLRNLIYRLNEVK